MTETSNEPMVDPRTGNMGYKCPGCGQWSPFRLGRCIHCAAAAHPFKNVKKVRVKATGKVGTVAYCYYNGYTLVQFPRKRVRGGLLNNDSTYANEELEAA